MRMFMTINNQKKIEKTQNRRKLKIILIFFFSRATKSSDENTQIPYF